MKNRFLFVILIIGMLAMVASCGGNPSIKVEVAAIVVDKYERLNTENKKEKIILFEYTLEGSDEVLQKELIVNLLTYKFDYKIGKTYIIQLEE